MISDKTLKSLEYDKILSDLASFAVLNKSKNEILATTPVTDIAGADFLLAKTFEAYKILYTHGLNGVSYFDDVEDELRRAELGGTLNNAEILRVSGNLKSARTVRNVILNINDDEIVFLKNIANRLIPNMELEKRISEVIVNEEEINDNSSAKLSSIRKEIKSINAKIRNQLNSFVRGETSKYLQDGVITIRQNRYVIPVKSEYRSFVKGFIHDQSQSGATVFIEPIQIIELNNDLKSALLDETKEIQRILAEISANIGSMASAIRNNAENLVEIDIAFAKANYSFKNKCTRPLLNDKGYIDIKKGRHPLIDNNKVVPVDIILGKEYNFILITGPNTGGKTVTLKLTGLFSLMSMSGIFIPCEKDSSISVFSGIYCDIGDEQSIEQSLSTFSSHLKNIIDIIDKVDEKSLVLLDEIGGGTDPDEGGALALAVIQSLLGKNCFGIVTTHYSVLKEFAVSNEKIINASMEFDVEKLTPLYKLNFGIPGSSNALEIAKMLGLDEKIINNAYSLLPKERNNFENVLKEAEKARREADFLTEELEKLKKSKENELLEITAEREKIVKEREKIYQNAKQETKRIVADKLAEAEEIIEELKSILKKVGLESKEVFRASELKNRLKNSKYLTCDDDYVPFEMKKTEKSKLKIGMKVFVKPFKTSGIIKEIKSNKDEAVVLIGDVKTVVKISEIFNAEETVEKTKEIKVSKPKAAFDFRAEINVIGKDVFSAIEEVESFIAQSVLHNVDEVKIIHGIGEGILLKSIREYLKKDKRVKEFRRGRYGEGENGVTVVTLR